MKQMQDIEPEVVNDTSEMAIFTEYEAQLQIRHVHLIEFEDRLK